MRDDSGWVDLQIENLSDKGLMAQTPNPPARGHYIEIRRFGHTLVGVVAWSKGDRFGVALSEVTDIKGLIAGSKPAAGGERRAHERKPRPSRTIVISNADDWRWIGRGFERASLLALALCATVVIGYIVHDTLAAPAEEIANTLAGRTP